MTAYEAILVILVPRTEADYHRLEFPLVVREQILER